MKTTLEQYYLDERENLLRRMSFRSGSPANSEDIVQEAFCRALQYQDTFNPDKKDIGSWFSSILTNALRNFKNDEKRYGMCEEFDEELYDPQPLTMKHKGIIHRMIEEKAEDAKEVLTLYFDNHYSALDISRVLDAKVNRVKSTISRFKDEVKERYGT